MGNVKNKKSYDQRDTVRMPKADIDAILNVDAAVASREAVHEHPTVSMPAVKP